MITGSMKRYLLPINFLIALFFAGCASAPHAPKKPLVLVSLAPYQFFAEKIGRGIVDVEVIVPPGMDAHTFEPPPRLADLFQKSTIWFRIGESFETKLSPLFEKHLEIVDLRDGVEILLPPREHRCCAHDTQDRHFWLSPKTASFQARKMEEALSKRFPEHGPLFRQHCDELILELSTLDAELKTLLKPLQGSSFVVSHPAFAYFCRDYGLKQLSLEREGKELGPRDLSRFLLQAQEDHPLLALTLPQHGKKGTECVAKELGLLVKNIDPYAYEYFDTMRLLARLLHGGDP